MKGRRLIAGFEIGVGAMMILMWAFFFFTGQIPELENKPIEISLHLAAEGMTAALLLFSGWALWKKETQAIRMSLFGLGMLTYTLVVSPGYYLGEGVLAGGMMFFFLLVLDLVCVMNLLKAKTLEQ